MPLRIDQIQAHAQALSDPEVARALQEYLDAIQASVEASRALLAAGPGERQRAHHAFMEATRRQANAERAYERLRRIHARAPDVGWPKMRL